MQPFLESLAIHLVRSEGERLERTQILLPNRRAGLFLQQHLARHSPRVQWSPRIYTISEYIEELSSLKLSDQVDNVFRLYDVYQQIMEQPQSIDEFYFWGEIMLKDFDELDKYLVDADMLFSNILDIKEIEEPLAGLDQEQIQFIRQFWTGFYEGDQTPEKEQFLDIWKRLPILYRRIREALESKGEGYQGMLFREIAERIEEDKLEYTWGGRTVVAGFNALNGCEKRIFSWLQQHEAEFYWDYDHQYTEDDSMEAGRFIRANLKLFPQQVALESFRDLEKEKQIRIFELPSDVLQAKTVHRILEKKDKNSMRLCTDTAVVLCDEELLMPVIMSMPDTPEGINVTMGYPMKNTPVFSFVDSLLRLQHNCRRSKRGVEQFYHKDVTSILLHPYMRRMDLSEDHPLIDEIIRSNLILVDRSQFTEELELKIFRQLEGPGDLIHYLKEIFQQLLEQLAQQTDKLQQELDREFIFQLLILLNKLEMLIESNLQITRAIMERLFRKMLSGLRIPFEGEPLSGLQLMGILETRLLDFTHVVLLSMNEEIMPASHTGQSYIPYAMRLAFRMPAREEMDAIYAYYFNRLLQRAEKIDLIYNSNSEGVRTGEMSRYLYQILYNRGGEVIRPGMEVKATENESIVVPHSPVIDRKLKNYLLNGGSEKYLSPSAINTFIDCSLKFYLRYLAGIGEPEEVQEEIDAAGFGTVVHEAIKVLYNEIAVNNQGILTDVALKGVLKSDKPEKVLRDVFTEHHFKGRKRDSLEGRNIIIFRVMLRYLQKIMMTDAAIAPFHLVSAERSYKRDMKITVGNHRMEIHLGGKIDRVDRVGDLLRVIDYKTGEAKQGFPHLEALFDPTLRSRNSAALQTLFYAWLVEPEHQGEQILPGLYVMKALYSEDFDPALTMGRNSDRKRIDNFAELKEHYLSLLTQVVIRMFDPGIPFVQTENEAKCRFCDFAGICNRTAID